MIVELQFMRGLVQFYQIAQRLWIFAAADAWRWSLLRNASILPDSSAVHIRQIYVAGGSVIANRFGLNERGQQFPPGILTSW